MLWYLDRAYPGAPPGEDACRENTLLQKTLTKVLECSEVVGSRSSRRRINGESQGREMESASMD